MIEYLGKVAENLVRHGMIVEHDLARLYVKQWDENFNVIIAIIC